MSRITAAVDVNRPLTLMKMTCFHPTAWGTCPVHV